MRIVLWLGLAAVIGALLFGWLQLRTLPAQPPAERPPVPVRLVEVEQGEFRDQASALGTLRAWESITVTSSVAQIVTEIAFEDGQQVRQGDVLARLKQDAEQATLRELNASLVDARRELRRLENLARQNQVALTDLDKARTQADVTQHRIEAVEARIADRTIVAPFSGVLGLRRVSEGALLSPGQELTTLDDISRMRLEFTLPTTLLAFLVPGQSVQARNPAFDRVFEGQISALDSRIDPVARSVRALAVLDNPEGLLRAGLLMEVVVQGAPRSALLVPEESLQSRSTRHYVWLVSADRARRTPVEIGARIPGWVEILGGLAEGDRVVRDGIGRLSGEEVPVKVVDY